jgi:hypothetical protein
VIFSPHDEPPPLLDPSVVQHHLNPAAWFYERLTKQVAKFSETLSADEAVALWYPMVGGVLDVRQIGFHGLDMIVLRGFDSEGRAAWLLLHMNATQLTIKAVSKKRDQPERRIGFLGQVAKDEDVASTP